MYVYEYIEIFTYTFERNINIFQLCINMYIHTLQEI